MQDILLRGLQKAARELELNERKSLHIKDLLLRLAQASEDHPHDQVIRIMEDVFQKRARHDQDRLVTAEEFDEVKQSLWNLNPRTALNQLFPDLRLCTGETKPEKKPSNRTDYSNPNRSLEPLTTSAELTNQARDLVLNSLKNAGLAYSQTHFVKGLSSNAAEYGLPSEGVMLFDAKVVTKAGESTLSIPVLIQDGKMLPPDSFAADGMYYPLSREGVSNFGLGLAGLSTDRFVEESRVFGTNELRDVPVVDSTAENLLRAAKEKVYLAFKESGVKNCQVRFASMETSEEDGTAVLAMEVDLPFARSSVQVPVTVDGDALVYSPESFVDNTGREFDISASGISTFLSTVSADEQIPFASRIEGDGTPRDIEAAEPSSFRSKLAVKVSDYLAKRGAINPQVYHVTSVDHGESRTESFVAVFGSERGDCHIAIPVAFKKGATVEPPQHFFGLDEKRYDLTSDGIKAYVETKNLIKPIQYASFHSEKTAMKIDADDLDSNVRKVSRRSGYELGERVITRQDDTISKLVERTREAVLRQSKHMGAVNPQVFLQGKEDHSSGSTLIFGADFQTARGVKRATVRVSVVGDEAFEPRTFIGNDNQVYNFSKEGMAFYIAEGEVPAGVIEAEITNKLHSLSYGDLREFVKNALFREDEAMVRSGIASMRARFGEETVANCIADLSSMVEAEETESSHKCGGCPFFRSKTDSLARTATDMCMKFNLGVHKVAFGGTHKNCTIKRQAVQQDEEFDGAIVTSRLKFT